MESISPEDWWQRLTPDIRERLTADPFGPVPGQYINAVTNAGRTPVASSWPSTGGGTDGFFLPYEVQEWIQDTHGTSTDSG